MKKNIKFIILYQCNIFCLTFHTLCIIPGMMCVLTSDEGAALLKFCHFGWHTN